MLQYRLAQKKGEREGGEGENAKLLCPQSPACKHPESSRQFNLPLTEAFFYFSPQFLLKNSEASPAAYTATNVRNLAHPLWRPFHISSKPCLLKGRPPSKDSPHQNLDCLVITALIIAFSSSSHITFFNCLKNGERGQNVSFLKVRALSRSRRETDGKRERKRTKEGCVFKRGYLNLASPCLVFPLPQMRTEASVRRSLKIRALFHNPLLILASQKSCLLCSSHQTPPLPSHSRSLLISDATLYGLNRGSARIFYLIYCSEQPHCLY